MKEHIKEHIIYIAEDGMEFENAVDCLQHEQANVFSKDMENILKVKNLPFVNGMLVDGYWCENQAQLDCCVSWWIEAQKSINRTCIAKSLFLKPDYYFILLDEHASDIKNDKYVYNFLSFSYLQQQWDNFVNLVPSDPYAYNVMQEIREKYNNFKPKYNNIEVKKDFNKENNNSKEHNNEKNQQKDILSMLNKKTKKRK